MSPPPLLPHLSRRRVRRGPWSCRRYPKKRRCFLKRSQK